MPYKIFWEEKGMYIKFSGIITAEENIRLNGEIYGNKLFEKIDYQIGDFSEATPSIFQKEIFRLSVRSKNKQADGIKS